MTAAHAMRLLYVYFHYSNDDLLYVGRTYHVDTRTRQHRGKSPWFPRVDRIEVAGPYTDAESRHLERHLITAYEPPYNRLHTSRHIAA